MVKDAQVGVLRRRLMEGKTQEASAAAAGMSMRSARKWEHGGVRRSGISHNLANAGDFVRRDIRERGGAAISGG